MAHNRRLFDDTTPQIEAMRVQHWRDTPPREKLAQMSSLNATIERLTLAGLARQYPGEAEDRLREHLRERQFGTTLLDQIRSDASRT